MIKLFLLICFFIWLRATLPRLRYDMLMKFGWKGVLPTALVNIVFIALCLALQQAYGNTVGWLITVALAAAVGAILFLIRAATYGRERRARAAAAATTEIAPIRRPATATHAAAREANSKV